jgi:DNA integrity scanning protein DisA with diadenylate cyclase activity
MEIQDGQLTRIAFLIQKYDHQTQEIQSIEKHLEPLKSERLETLSDLAKVLGVNLKDYTNDALFGFAYRKIGEKMIDKVQTTATVQR